MQTITTPTRLTVCYDEQCALCRRCRAWLEGQPVLVPLDFVAAGSPEARQRYGSVPWLGADLVVVDDEAGGVWAGPAAFIMCLWATAQYRGWSYRLSGRALAPLAERFFHMVSANRRKIGAVVGSRDCPDGRCSHRTAPSSAWSTPSPAAQMYGPVTRCRRCGVAVYQAAPSCWSCGATEPTVGAVG